MTTAFFGSALRCSPLLVALAFAGTGCVVAVYDDHDGLLTVQWSVDGTFHRDACFDYDARTIELVIYDRYDDILEQYEARCADFGASIELPDGVYGLDATLLGRSGRAVTTTLALEFDIYEDEETFVDIDFPLRSRL